MKIKIVRLNLLRIGSILATGLFFAMSCSAAWQAGVARVDITPTQPVWMGGYAARTHPSEGARQHIFVKALALKDDTGAVTVLVTSDLLGFPGDVSAPIFSRVQQRFGLPRERVVLNSSHTHSAPVVGNMLSPAYPYDEGEIKVVKAFTAKLQTQVVEVIGEAIQNMAPAELSFEQGLAGVAVNRRRVGHREYPGPVEQDVPVLAVRAPDNTLRAIVFGYACHNTVLDDYQINGDWPMTRKRRLRKSIRELRQCSSRTAGPTRTQCRGARWSLPSITGRPSPLPSTRLCVENAPGSGTAYRRVCERRPPVSTAAIARGTGKPHPRKTTPSLSGTPG